MIEISKGRKCGFDFMVVKMKGERKKKKKKTCE
jgi:hypothetical protein